MRTSVAGLSLVGLMACATATPPPVVAPPLQPSAAAPGTLRVALLARRRQAGDLRNYAAEGSGLGVSLRYDAPFGFADLYVYDADEAGLLLGLDDARTRQQFILVDRHATIMRRFGATPGAGEARAGVSFKPLAL